MIAIVAGISTLFWILHRSHSPFGGRLFLMLVWRWLRLPG